MCKMGFYKNNANGGYIWFLEHVTTRARVLLSFGDNIIGRHSRCNIVLNEFYDYLSREHLNIIVDRTGVKLRSMNSLNGTFHNGERLEAEDKPAFEGDMISLGVPDNPVPPRHGVFRLGRIRIKLRRINANIRLLKPCQKKK